MTKIGSNDDCYSSNNIHVDEVIVKYSQEPDCTEDRDNYQEITISSRDGGGGPFLNIKSETGWSIENSKEFSELLDDFTKRLEIVSEYECTDNVENFPVEQNSNS